MTTSSATTARRLTVVFEADRKTHTFTWFPGKELWSMQVDFKDGGSTHWWATVQENAAWIIGRGYMATWSQAHFRASEELARAIVEEDSAKEATRIVLTESVDARNARRIETLRRAAALAEQERDRARVEADRANAELVRINAEFQIRLNAYNEALDAELFR